MVVSHDGVVQWAVPMQVKTGCPVDATYFPYDKQTCQIQFGSWIHDSSQLAIELSPSRLDLSHYTLNSEFDLLNSNLEKITMNGSCCPGSGDRHMVRVWLKIRRKTLYYDYIVIAPTIDLCVLTLATFLLPCECGWKIAIGLTVFLTLYVLQLLIAENVPDTNSTPLIGKILCQYNFDMYFSLHVFSAGSILLAMVKVLLIGKRPYEVAFTAIKYVLKSTAAYSNRLICLVGHFNKYKIK